MYTFFSISRFDSILVRLKGFSDWKDLMED